MKRAAWFVLCLLAGATAAFGQVATNQPRLTYTLLDGSSLIDECLVCGRPTIVEPLRGTFELVLLADIAPYTKFAVQDVRFRTGPDGWLDRTITGSGFYSRFEEFARVQDMQLSLNIKDNYTNRTAYFTNATPIATAPAPLIEMTLVQTNGTLLQTFTLKLFAAPVREIWFSTTLGFKSGKWNAPTNYLSDGDVLSTRGRVVKRNLDLIGRLGLMPVVEGNLGLDALQLGRAGQIFFSLPRGVFSERLGYLQHGDVLSNDGAIVRRNQALLAAFKPTTTNDAGLDALETGPNGEFYFSITTNVTTESGITLTRGDILSEKGVVVVPFRKLIEHFHPSASNLANFGLDALHILPGGEIWFSVEEAFTDTVLGPISAGDLLSDSGYRVMKNADLVAAFAPSETGKDYGLDGVFIIADNQPPKPPPRLLRTQASSGTVNFDWDGDGSVFQLEASDVPTGPFTPVGDIVPDRHGEASLDSASTKFFRLRQW